MCLSWLECEVTLFVCRGRILECVHLEFPVSAYKATLWQLGVYVLSRWQRLSGYTDCLFPEFLLSILTYISGGNLIRRHPFLLC